MKDMVMSIGKFSTDYFSLFEVPIFFHLPCYPMLTTILESFNASLLIVFVSVSCTLGFCWHCYLIFLSRKETTNMAGDCRYFTIASSSMDAISAVGRLLSAILFSFGIEIGLHYQIPTFNQALFVFAYNASSSLSNLPLSYAKALRLSSVRADKYDTFFGSRRKNLSVLHTLLQFCARFLSCLLDCNCEFSH